MHEPLNSRYTYVYGIALSSMQKKEEALSFLENSLQHHPYDRDILYSLVTITYELGKKKESLVYAEQLIEY